MSRAKDGFQKPLYAIGSVDSALRALHLLRDSGALRITDLARALGVSPSTAHRVLAMLVYQGFAVQDDRLRYVAGPALCAPVVLSERNAELARAARPILEQLRSSCGETVSLAVRIGVHARVLLTLGGGPDELGDRHGHVYPAHASSAGRALLAAAPDELLGRLYGGDGARLRATATEPPDLAVLMREIGRTRDRGFAVCEEEIHRGVSSVAVPVVAGPQPCAIVILAAATRLSALQADPGVMDALFAAQRGLVRALGHDGDSAPQN
jgi:DNA-binding IclR family transcriptional regulator